MKYETVLTPDESTVLRQLGYRSAQADAQTDCRLRTACAEAVQAAQPRWIYTRWELLDPPVLKGTDIALPGQNIARHLQGCAACFLLAVTLGGEVERAIRAAEATDMAYAVLLDAAASQLVEQYADETERILRRQVRAERLYLTGRYSPGYGDFPLGLQKDVLRLLDAPKTIGLTVAQSGILLPRKSITAVLGIADHPVSGRLADCEGCVLKGKCEEPKEGGGCGKSV